MVNLRYLGSFYNYISTSEASSHRDAVGALINDSGSIVTSNSDKADVLNAYYASVSIADNGRIPTCPSLTFKETIETVDFHERGVIAAINKT